MHKRKEQILILTPRTGTETFTEHVREKLKKSLWYSTHDIVESQMSIENVFDFCMKNNIKIVIMTASWLKQESEKRFILRQTISDLATSNTKVILSLTRNPETSGSRTKEEIVLGILYKKIREEASNPMNGSNQQSLSANIFLGTYQPETISHLSDLFDSKTNKSTPVATTTATEN